METRIKDKIAIVTASTKGIGLEIALSLAKEGARVYLAARNQELAEEIINSNRDLELFYVNFDVDDKSVIENAINKVYEKEQKIDILVNTYGAKDLSKDKTILDTDYDDFLKIYDKNISSVFITTQIASKYMKEQKSGSIINVSTIWSTAIDNQRIAYTTSKAAINALTKATAFEMSKYNVRCNAILPGLIASNIIKDNISPQYIERFLKYTPLNRVGNPIDIANVVTFLASDLSSYITGEILEVAGGFHKFAPLDSEYNK